MRVVSLVLTLHVLLAAVCSVHSRKHKLTLVDEHRNYFIISSFGLRKGGSITFDVTGVQFKRAPTHLGFSIHRSSEESTEYNLNQVELSSCIFTTTDLDPETMRIPLNKDTMDFEPPYETLSSVTFNTSVVRENSTTGDVTVWNRAIITLNSTQAEDIYTIAFHLCHEAHQAYVDIRMRIVEVNPGPEYLGAGLAPLPTVYACMAGLFFLALCGWIYVMWINKDSIYLYKTHWLMLLLLFVKDLSLIFHAVDFFFIRDRGTEDEGWAYTYYVLQTARGLLLFITVLLIGAGFGFVKPILSKKEKQLFMVVLPLQVFANIASAILEETDEGIASRSTWRSIALLVDLLCCGAILFPVVWSIRHLKDASQIDGKAAMSLSKLRLFRRFYVMVLVYIYTTRIVVYLVQSTIPFRYEWMGPFFNEAVTLVFYVITGYMFSPFPNNEYLLIPNEEDGEEIQMDEIVTTNSGITEESVQRTRAGMIAETEIETQRRAKEAREAEGLRRTRAAIEEEEDTMY